MKKNFVILALGSNLGNRHENLRKAAEILGQIVLIDKCSSIYQSAAMLPENAPDDWNNDFYNCVLFGNTKLDVFEILEFCHSLEQDFSRTESDKGTWAPRYLDVDIIAFNEDIIDQEILQIPHPRMLSRSFVVEPLKEILPEWMHPVERKKIKEFNNIDLLNIRKLDLKIL